MKQPSEDDIIHALEQSGYLFEQDVATLLSNMDFHVETSWAFPDSELEKSREIDIRAIRRIVHEERKFQMMIELLVECKDFESPLVFLERRKNARELNHAVPNEYVFPHGSYFRRTGKNTGELVPAFIHLGLRDKHYYFRDEKAATQFSKIVRKGDKWLANHDGIYDALILPLAKALEFRKKDIRSNFEHNEWKTVWLFFPIVAVRDYLFAYDLSGPKRALGQRGRISFVRHLEQQALKGYYLIDFTTYDYLEAHIAENLAPFWTAILDLVKENPDRILSPE